METLIVTLATINFLLGFFCTIVGYRGSIKRELIFFAISVGSLASIFLLMINIQWLVALLLLLVLPIAVWNFRQGLKSPNPTDLRGGA